MSETAKTLTFLAVAAVALLAGWASQPRIVNENVGSRVGQVLSEGFTDPGEAKRLKITAFNEDSATLREFEVAEEDGLWTIPSKDGYPADAERQMAEAATSLMDRKILSIASESAADHEQLGVIDPLSPKMEAGQKGVGTHVTISDIQDKPLVDLIIGREVKDASNDQHYVREANRDVVYIAEVDPAKLSTSFDDWIEKDLLKLNAWDIEKVQINDYSAELQPVMTPQGVAIQVAWDPRSELKLSYDDKDSKWTAEELKEFNKGTESYTEFKVADDQQLNSEKLDALKTALDDLAIVDVDHKPAGLSADLKAGVDFLDNPEARKDLRTLGFATVPNRDGTAGQELISSEGEVIVTMKDGVEYVLRFGDLRLTAGDDADHAGEATDAASAAAAAAKKAKAGDKSVQRYLFAMARFNENAIKKPELEALPPLPAEEEAPAATDKESAAAPATPEEKADDAKNAPVEEEEEEEAATQSDPAEASSLKQAGESTDAKETNKAETDKAATDQAEADKSDAEAKAPAAAPEPKHSPEYERILAERKRIEIENQRKLDEYNALVAKGKEQVKELNLRFGDWYFVVSDETFKKVRLGKNDIVQKKGAPAAAGPNNSAAGAPGTAIPGLPGFPGLQAVPGGGN